MSRPPATHPGATSSRQAAAKPSATQLAGCAHPRNANFPRGFVERSVTLPSITDLSSFSCSGLLFSVSGTSSIVSLRTFTGFLRTQSSTANTCSFRAHYVHLGRLPLTSLRSISAPHRRATRRTQLLARWWEQLGLTKAEMSYGRNTKVSPVRSSASESKERMLPKSRCILMTTRTGDLAERMRQSQSYAHLCRVLT